MFNFIVLELIKRKTLDVFVIEVHYMYKNYT